MQARSLVTRLTAILAHERITNGPACHPRLRRGVAVNPTAGTIVSRQVRMWAGMRTSPPCAYRHNGKNYVVEEGIRDHNTLGGRATTTGEILLRQARLEPWLHPQGTRKATVLGEFHEAVLLPYGSLDSSSSVCLAPAHFPPSSISFLASLTPFPPHLSSIRNELVRPLFWHLPSLNTKDIF